MVVRCQGSGGWGFRTEWDPGSEEYMGSCSHSTGTREGRWVRLPGWRQGEVWGSMAGLVDGKETGCGPSQKANQTLGGGGNRRWQGWSGTRQVNTERSEARWVLESRPGLWLVTHAAGFTEILNKGLVHRHSIHGWQKYKRIVQGKGQIISQGVSPMGRVTGTAS